MGNLTQQLTAYGDSDYYGFHMPGHKRNETLLGNALPFHMDITEIEGFDDLHHADGILLESEQRAAKVYGVKETHFLINGSTSGNLSAIMACTTRGGRILMARNNHRSVYNAVFMQELTPTYLYPDFDETYQLNMEVKAADVELAFQEHPDIQAVVIVSPTYDGVVSDVRAIAQIAHQYGAPLIVDEAHGAHFGFHPYFPASANKLGADIAIHSVHKTLPSLTQTALLHVNGSLVDSQKVKKYLRIFQSSSPSYVLMASIDNCMQLLEGQGDQLFQQYVERLQALRHSLKEMKHLQLVETKHYDRSKIVISTRKTSLTSQELYRQLHTTYHLQMEMVAGTYIVAMTSLADTQEGFERLAKALHAIDQNLTWEPDPETEQINEVLGKPFPRPELVHTSSEMERIKDTEEQSVSREYRYLYPPGIPIVVPGERITGEILELERIYEEAGFIIERS